MNLSLAGLVTNTRVNMKVSTMANTIANMRVNTRANTRANMKGVGYEKLNLIKIDHQYIVTGTLF